MIYSSGVGAPDCKKRKLQNLFFDSRVERVDRVDLERIEFQTMFNAA